MNVLKLNLVGALVATFFAFSAHAAFVDAGFESGDLTDWTGNDLSKAEVVSSHDSFDFNTTYTAYGPAYGNNFVRIISGLGEDEYTTLSRSFFLNIGDQLSGVAAFDTGDYSPFNDNAYVQVEDPSMISTTLWSQDVNGVGDNGNSPWTQWGFTAQSSGIYTITFGVANNLDNGLDSIAIFDLPQVRQIPDSGSSLMLLGFGLTSIFGMRRRTVSA